MKFTFRKIPLITLGIAVMCFGLQTNAWADDDDDEFERMFVFGDSLSDPGNVYALIMQTSQPPYDVIPSAPYDFRGFQFTNGKTWAQLFARHLDMASSGKSALVSPGRFGNYAFAGARARTTTDPLATPSAQQQFHLYLSDYHGEVYGDALYVVQFGGNDIRDAIETFLGTLAVLVPPGEDPSQAAIDAATLEAAKVIQAGVEANLALIGELQARGARNILLASAPNLGFAPAIKFAGPEAVAIASLLSSAYNDSLDAGLALVAAPGVSINRLDLFAIIAALIEDPRAAGLRNVDTPCLMFFVEENAVCRRPNKYLFWDGIHPTAKVHRIVSEVAAGIYDD